jgi:hypothetical protein
MLLGLRVDLFKRWVESGQGQVIGHLAWPVPDSCLVSGWVGLVHASLFYVSDFFVFGSGFLALGQVFLVGSGFGSKIMARTRPVNYYGSKNTTRTRLLVWSDRVGPSFLGWVESSWSGWVAHGQVYPRVCCP